MPAIWKCWAFSSGCLGPWPLVEHSSWDVWPVASHRKRRKEPAYCSASQASLPWWLFGWASVYWWPTWTVRPWDPMNLRVVNGWSLLQVASRWRTVAYPCLRRQVLKDDRMTCRNWKKNPCFTSDFTREFWGNMPLCLCCRQNRSSLPLSIAGEVGITGGTYSWFYILYIYIIILYYIYIYMCFIIYVTYDIMYI